MLLSQSTSPYYLTMKRLSSSKIKRAVHNVVKGEIEWELRPDGKLVQKIEMGDAPSGPMVIIKVSHGTYHHDITMHAQYTFGYLKKVLAQETGLEPKEHRLLFQGKEKDDEECLHMVGVKDMSKVILLEDPASKEMKLVEMKRNQSVVKACEELSKVRAEIDKLSEKVNALEAIVGRGTKVAVEQLLGLTELPMVQLLQLHTIESEGEDKVQRRAEVRHVQGLVDTMEEMKARNYNPSSGNGDAHSVSSKWEAFECGGSAPLSSSTRITQD